MLADTREVLYAENENEQLSMASTTKIMTSLLALESGLWEQQIKVTSDMVAVEGTSIGLLPDDLISVRTLISGMLLESGNDAANVTAYAVAGGQAQFLELMNQKAAEIGMKNTHFDSVSGLDTDSHYSTAYDMALIVSELYKHEEFCTVSQTLNYTIGPTNLTDEPRYVQQKHKMLWPENSNYYEYCTGGKTGYTDDSRTTLVTTAENGTLRLVAVVLRNNRDVYQDTRSILDYVFRNFSKVLLKEQEKPEEVRSYTDDNAYVLLPSGIDFSSLDHQITVTDEVEASGRITFYYEGQNVGSTDVTLTPEYVEEATGYTTRKELSEKPDAGGAEKDEDGGDGMQIPVWLACVAAVVLAVAAVLCALVLRARYIRAKRRREARRRRRRKQPPRRRSQKR